MSAGQPNYPDGGEMLSSFRSMLVTTMVTCVALSGCSSDMFEPGALDAVSASVTRSTTTAGPITVVVPDSILSVGDTIRLSATARNSRTRRDVSNVVRFLYSSADTSVDRRGLVTAKAPGTTKIVVRSMLGRVSVVIAVETDAPVVATLDSATARNIPDVPTAAPEPDPEPAPPLSGPNEVSPELGVTPPFNAPMLPAATVNVAMPRVTGKTIRVPAGDNAALQAALNAAVGGDEVVLANNADYVGNFVLPKHSGSDVVIVRSETVGVPAGTRVTPARASSFARISTTNVAAAIATGDGASKWRLMGISVHLRPGAVDNYGIVTLGRGNETAISQFVTDIVLDRVLISGGETGNTSRCVSFNGNALAVIDSWLADCHAKGRDAQGIGGWTGQGPFLIENNHIEGSGQAVMFGGADPSVQDVTPSDATIRGNHFFKPMSWINGRWTVKAAFELKHARRVLFEGNVIQNHWADAQTGFAILFQAVSQDNHALWSKVWDVTVRNNIIRNSTSGFNLLSRYSNNGLVPRDPTRRILVRNNLFLNVGKDPVSGANGRMMQLMGDHEDVSVIQNTFFGAAEANNAVMFDGAPNKRLTLFNNVFSKNAYGILGSGFGEGNASLVNFAPNAIVEGNVLTGQTERFYPSRNSFPSSISTADFVNAAGGDYTLRATVSYSANGGSLVGVNGAAIRAATANAIVP
jgi:Right handed beta helix region